MDPEALGDVSNLSSMLDISMSQIMAGLIFGAIGLWMFRRGKHNANMKVLAIGLALMVYPYFTHGPWQDWGIGIALCGFASYVW
jgi:hypothetical protein